MGIHDSTCGDMGPIGSDPSEYIHLFTPIYNNVGFLAASSMPKPLGLIAKSRTSSVHLTA